MQHISTSKNSVRILFSILLGLFFNSGLYAQSPVTTISDYVLFGSNSVQLGSSSKIQGGSVGSFKLVQSTGGFYCGTTSFKTNIYSGGTVVLANSSSVYGKITAANSLNASGTILSVGTGANLIGNIDVKGNIVIGGGTVTGVVTNPTNNTYKLGNVTKAGIGNPTLPVLPSLPAITNYSAGGSNVSSGTISPGSYGNLTLGNNTIKLNGPGIYYFKSINTSGPNASIIYDFKNTTTGNFIIYVVGDVELNKTNFSMTNGGSASRIYLETHGNGSGCSDDRTTSFNMSKGSNGNGNQSNWLGTVWAPYGGIKLGSPNGPTMSATGAFWSATKVDVQSNVDVVYAPFLSCVTPNVNAGADKPLDFANPTMLTGTSTTPNVSFSWQAINGGVIISPANASTITVSSAGTYILTATSGTNCTAKDTVIVTGKLNNLIGSELSSVVQNFDPNGPPSPFFMIQNDSIVIDIIVKAGKYSEALAKFKAAPYGLASTDIFTNGNSNYIITGLSKISLLSRYNSETDLVVYVRPHYVGFTNSGLVSSAGDTSMKSHLVREGYQVQGEGVKVGVISNSFATITAGTTTPFRTNTATQDVSAGDLPGAGNPAGNVLPVHVLRDYPFRSSDEGRGMLQIVHDVAPKAELYFRTGFISAGDFAVGIQELKDAGCNIIVDDVTYPTEPFLKDGVVANAVDAVTAAGVTYFSSAGNFANKSYENAFSRIAGGNAHNYGGGDSLQSVTLQPGNYTIVLQWEDNIYSLGQTAGTQNDLDIYLTPDGNSLFGFNRDNTNGDPIEILPFTITGTTPVNTNILIRNNTIGNNPSRIKYIVFQGDITINEYNAGTSTIIGQANALGAIAVGAARFNKTDSIESFSSIGGTFVNSTQRQKPDITAPDGVNTTVNLGPDYASTALDGYSNFFGTSAAAPHAAGVAALIMEGRNKFLQDPVLHTPVITSPAQIKTILQTSATDMYPTITPGFDLKSGAGFINADSAMRTFAKPFPTLITLVVPPSVTPGQAPFTLTLNGLNLSPTSVIKFRDSTLGTTIINSSTASAGIPTFTGNPIISVYTPPVSPSGIDGGSSDSLRFFQIVKKNITIKADNKAKKYAQSVPELTATIFVDGDSLQHTPLTLADLGLTNLSVTTLATATSSVGTYIITPARVFDPNNPADLGFNELYNYAFTNGSLSIEKLPVTITAENATATYGEKIPDIQFTYQFDGTNIPDSAAFSNSLQSAHQSQLAKDDAGNDILGLVNGKAVTIVNGKAVPIVNGDEAAIVNGKAVTIVNGKAVPIVNGKAVTIVNGKAVTIVNNLTENDTQGLSFLATAPALQNAREITNKTLGNITGTTKVVDIAQESILDFNDNSAQTYMLGSVSDVSPKGLVDIESITNGKAVTIVNGDESIEIVNGKAVTIVNGKAVTIVNGEELTIVNGKAVTIVNGKAVTIVNGKAVPIVNGESKTAVILDESEIGQGQSHLKSLNMLTGLDVGDQFVIPGSLLNDNLAITSKVGVINIVPAPVVITPIAGQTKVFGADDPVFTYTNNGGLAASDFTGAIARLGNGDVGMYAYTLGTLSAGANYSLTLGGTNTFAITAKKITITPTAGQSKVFGSPDPVFTFTNDAGLALSGFTGALGRVTGNNVGSYAYTTGNLSAGTNYSVVLSAIAPIPTFAITVKSVIITPIAGQTKVYGTSDPVLTFTNNCGLASSAFTGALSRANGNNVGSYAFTLGSLSAGINYSLSLNAINPFTITKAPLQVKADDKVMCVGDSYPTFTSTITGLVNGDNPTVKYSLSPSCAGWAGVYSIIPSLAGFANSGNYAISYTNGKLYINPKGLFVEDVHVYLDCVEDRGASYLPKNRRYIAHLYAKNNNGAPVYVAVGTDNKVSSSGSFDASQQPVIFSCGTTRFDIPFDGTSVKWELRTYNCYSKVLNSVTASSSSKKCTIYAGHKVADTNTSLAELKGISSVENATEIIPAGNVNAFPNPARNRATVYISDDVINVKGLILYDANGKQHTVKGARQISTHAVEIDLSGLTSGMYFIKVKGEKGYRNVTIVKE